MEKERERMICRLRNIYGERKIERKILRERVRMLGWVGEEREKTKRKTFRSCETRL